MSIDLDKVFSGFNEADPTSSGARQPGIKVPAELVVKVENVRFKESEQYNAIYYIVEFTVVEVVKDPENKVKVEKTYAWAHDVTNKWFGLSNTKQFLAAALGIEPDSEEAQELGRNDIEESFSEEQPLKGQLVRLKTAPKTTKGGYDIVVHDWAPHEDE